MKESRSINKPNDAWGEFKAGFSEGFFWLFRIVRKAFQKH